MEFENSRKYQKLTKTDKYTWSKKEETVNTLSPNWTNTIFSICIYNVIKFFFQKI